MEYKVKSLEGLPYAVADVWKLKPILCIGPDAFEVVHPKMQNAVDLILTDEDGKLCQMRARKIEPIHSVAR